MRQVNANGLSFGFRSHFGSFTLELVNHAIHYYYYTPFIGRVKDNAIEKRKIVGNGRLKLH